MSAFRSQQLPCRRIASFGRYTLTGSDPGRRVPPLPPALTSPSSIPRAPLSRLTLTDGRMVRAAWHTSMAHCRSVVAWDLALSGAVVLCGVLTSVLFSSRAPPFTSSLPTRNPLAPIPFPDPEPQLQSGLQWPRPQSSSHRSSSRPAS